MNITQLKYVLAIAGSSSMREASTKLFVSQPALSASVRDLEDELGILIFDRTNKGITLTDQGPMQMIQNWYKGFWELLGFSMQMALIVVTGSCVANAPLVKRCIDSLACIPNSGRSAAFLVTFVSVIDRHTLRVRTWERRIGETASCATSVCAAAAVAQTLGLTDEGETGVRTAGGLMTVRSTPEGLWLSGDAVLDFEGVVDV